MKPRLLLLCLCLASMPMLFAQISNTATTITVTSGPAIPNQACPWNNIASTGPGVTYEMWVTYEDGDNFGVLKRLPATGTYPCTVTNNGITPPNNGPNLFINAPAAAFPTVATTSSQFDFPQTKGTLYIRNIATQNTNVQAWEYDQYVCDPLPIFLSYFRLDPNYNYAYTNFLKFDWQAEDESDYLSHYILQKSYNNFRWYDEVMEPAQTGMGSHPYSVYANKPGSSYVWYRLKWIGEYGYTRTSASFMIPTNTGAATNIVCNYTNITGLASACAPQTTVYKLHNAPASGATYNWSASGATINSVYQGGLTTNVTFNWGGTATLYANAANNSCNKSKTVTVGGAGSLYIQTNSTTLNQTYTRYILAVNILPGTTASQYTWYKNGAYVGTGQSQTFFVYGPDNCDLIEVRVPTSCGEVVASRYICFQPPPPNPCDPPPYEPKVGPVPAKDKLIISMMRYPICPVGPLPRIATTLSRLYTIQLYDMYGNLKLEKTKVSFNTDVQLDIRNLPTGNYILFMKNAEHTVRKQVRIE